MNTTILPRSFAPLAKLIATAESENMKVFANIEGENMLLRNIELDDLGVRIRYGSTKRGQYSTVLNAIWRVGQHCCQAIDEDEEQVFIWAKHRRRMNSIPATEPTADERGYIGQVYGQLTIIQTMGWSQRNRMAFCQCTCGGVKLARISSLRLGWVISCGCRRGKNTELPLEADSTYGNFTVIQQVERPADQTKKEGYYLVRCICGTEQIRGRRNIVTPKQPDCGCRGMSLLEGQRFGKLVILGESKKSDNQRLVLTRCDCGTESFARLGSLRRGKKKSCGCLKTGPRSKQENNATNALGKQGQNLVYCDNEQDKPASIA